MQTRRLIPHGFTPPARADGPGFHLRMLTIHDLVKDYDAVIASGPRIKATGRAGTWPDGLTLEGNLVDLGWHQREFLLGFSFAYTVMNDDETRCLGCAYINPPDRPGFDATAWYWARDDQTDVALGQVFRALVAQFPLTQVAFPGRDHAWVTGA